jgi:hypothetical protein
MDDANDLDEMNDLEALWAVPSDVRKGFAFPNRLYKKSPEAPPQIFH